MTTPFEELPWHDAELRAFSVDRSEPGIADQVRLFVAWPDGSESEVLFSDCYAMTAEMNFGVIARETISGARISRDTSALVALKMRWANIGVALDDLLCFEIETSSTASTLQICAKRFEVHAPKGNGS
jgi:hypothetical protein